MIHSLMQTNVIKNSNIFFKNAADKKNNKITKYL